LGEVNSVVKYFTSSALEMRCDEGETAHVEPGTVELVPAELVHVEPGTVELVHAELVHAELVHAEQIPAGP